MALFSFSKKRGSIALIDIGSASIGGAYVYYVEGKEPVMYYTVRKSIERRRSEHITDSMLRTLYKVEELLVLEGAPALRRETGSAQVDKVIASIGAPWQNVEVATKTIEHTRSFPFTRELLIRAAEHSFPPRPDEVPLERSVIATLLNGHEIAHPFGQHVRRADVVILSASMKDEVAQKIHASARSAFHSHEFELIGFTPAAFAAFRDLYPHQKDYTLLDVSGSATDMLVVKNGILRSVLSISHGTHGMREEGGMATWLLALEDAFRTVSRQNSLSNTLFFFSDEIERDHLKQALSESNLQDVSLPGETFSVIPITPSQLAPFIKTRGLAEGDIFLALLALFYQKQFVSMLAHKDTEKGV